MLRFLHNTQHEKPPRASPAKVSALRIESGGGPFVKKAETTSPGSQVEASERALPGEPTDFKGESSHLFRAGSAIPKFLSRAFGRGFRAPLSPENVNFFYENSKYLARTAERQVGR